MRTLLLLLVFLVSGSLAKAQYAHLANAVEGHYQNEAKKERQSYRNVGLNFYKRFLSPQLLTNCGFEPSCSAYSQACFKHHGFAKALLLSVFRLNRCNTWTHTELGNKFPDTGTDDSAADY